MERRYFIVIFRYGLVQGDALNSEQPADCVEQPAGDIARNIRVLVLKLFAEFLSADGKYVDYQVSLVIYFAFD